MNKTNEEVAILETRDLKKYFKVPAGMLHAVDGINLRIERGKTLGVVGESGCGKTTLGRTIVRLLEPTSGEILFEGKNILEYSRKERKQMCHDMQLIFQDPYSSINPRMTVIEIIAEFLIVQKIYRTKNEAYQRAAELMDIVGLARRYANSYPHELDGGRRQRIGIARALALNPKFIVCDEPVSALDVSIQAQILNLLMDLQDDMGLTYMFITHDLSVVKHISDHIMVMYLGEAVEICESERIFENPLHAYTKALLAAIPKPDVTKRNEAIEVIRGEVSNPINPKPGCRFAPRCPLAMDICHSQNPALIEVEHDHKVACHMVHKCQ